jgi:hypothetical protein
MSFPHLGGVLKLGFTSSFVPISKEFDLGLKPFNRRPVGLVVTIGGTYLNQFFLGLGMDIQQKNNPDTLESNCLSCFL